MAKWKKRTLTVLGILILLIVAGYIYLFMGTTTKDANSKVTRGTAGTKSLVVYFSRCGELAGDVDAVSSATTNSNIDMDGSDTEAAAKMIQRLTGADLYQLHTKRYYRKAFFGTAATAWIEENFNLRPALAALPNNLGDYDTIYIGYAEGYSGGGETMSQVMGIKPELFTAYLQGSSQWDGEYDAVVESRTPVYLVVGESDEYYGSGPSEEAYQNIHDLYKKEGLSERQFLL